MWELLAPGSTQSLLFLWFLPATLRSLESQHSFGSQVVLAALTSRKKSLQRTVLHAVMFLRSTSKRLVVRWPLAIA